MNVKRLREASKNDIVKHLTKLAEIMHELVEARIELVIKAHGGQNLQIVNEDEYIPDLILKMATAYVDLANDVGLPASVVHAIPSPPGEKEHDGILINVQTLSSYTKAPVETIDKIVKMMGNGFRNNLSHLTKVVMFIMEHPEIEPKDRIKAIQEHAEEINAINPITSKDDPPVEIVIRGEPEKENEPT